MGKPPISMVNSPRPALVARLLRSISRFQSQAQRPGPVGTISTKSEEPKIERSGKIGETEQHPGQLLHLSLTPGN